LAFVQHLLASVVMVDVIIIIQWQPMAETQRMLAPGPLLSHRPFVGSVWLQAGCIFAIAMIGWTPAQKWNCSLFASWDQVKVEVT